MFQAEWIGFLAAGLTTFSFLPQVLKVIKTHSTHDISLWMYLLMAVGIILWLIYGLLLNSGPLIFSNAVTIVFVTIILVYKVFLH